MKFYKKCTKCKNRKWLGKFRGIGVLKSGESKFHPWCKECEKAYHEKRKSV